MWPRFSVSQSTKPTREYNRADRILEHRPSVQWGSLVLLHVFETFVTYITTSGAADWWRQIWHHDNFQFSVNLLTNVAAVLYVPMTKSTREQSRAGRILGRPAVCPHSIGRQT